MKIRQFRFVFSLKFLVVKFYTNICIKFDNVWQVFLYENYNHKIIKYFDIYQYVHIIRFQFLYSTGWEREVHLTRMPDLYS